MKSITLYTALLHAATVDLGHIDKLRMLRIAFYWGVRLEPVDPDVTSTCQCARLNRKSPQSARSPKKANRENGHVISSVVHDLFHIWKNDSMVYEARISCMYVISIASYANHAHTSA